MEKVMRNRTLSGSRGQQEQPWEIEHRLVARRAAVEGMVLLKNENHILPLDTDTRIAIYGAGASRTIKGGTGSGDVNERDTVSIYRGMKEAGYPITNEEWIKDYDLRYENARVEWKENILKKAEGAGDKAEDFFAVYSTSPFVLPVGKKADKTDAEVAFYIVSRVAGEGSDRFADKGDYYLREEELQMLADVCKYHRDVIVVVNTGGLVDLSFMDTFKNICGLLQIVQPGMEGGHAFADVVSGKVNPSGKLTDSWAYQYEDYPNSAKYSHNNGNVEIETYDEGIYVGYRYFDSFGVSVRYSFGYGQSYTTFSIEKAKIRRTENKELEVSATVENTGNVKGREVVQVYASLPGGRLEKEAHRLVAYGKSKELRPGEREELSMKIPVSRLASYDEEFPGWVLEAGMYGMWIGNSLSDIRLFGGVQLEQEVSLARTEHICPLKQALKELSQTKETCQRREADCRQALAESRLPVVILKKTDCQTETMIYKRNSELVEKEAKKFVDALSPENLIDLAAGDPGKAQGGNLGAAGISVPGSAGETHRCAAEKGLASIVLADGPAGLRLMKYYHVADGKIVSMPFQFSLEGGLFCDGTEELQGERYYQYCTAIPVGTLLAQTWDTGLLREVGQMIGKEMEYYGVTLWLAPGMNIHRNPLCGRNFEYYSEDPLLAGTMAAAMTEGVQENPGCGTTIKHFACNNQEDNRKGSDSVLSERALREIYLKGFEIAVKTAQPMSIMTSYNLINGVHAANSYDLCTQAARNEWGFKGVVMTDWTTTENDETCTAAGCIRAGNDLVMPGCVEDHENLKQELREGTLDIEDLKACIARLVRIIWKSNQYENPAPYKEEIRHRV